MERVHRDQYRLSTGREFSANHGLISIAEQEGGVFEIGEGYDGELLEATNAHYESNFTPDECRELADFMIQQWTAYRDAQETPA